mmetsp:Transcript_6696/g.25117  ORF Transcript_6696/g.25117 Transcript_6696/m.25117 type:complete len:441 (-) Transcript_6696:119-1441(-)
MRTERIDGLKANGEANGEASADRDLPRSSPFVGFLSHAPRRFVRTDQLEHLLRRRASPSSPVAAPAEGGATAAAQAPVLAPATSSRAPPPTDLRKLPYVGYQRHAPPSPLLRFQAPFHRPLRACVHTELEGELPELILAEGLQLMPPSLVLSSSPAGGLPMEIWLSVLSNIIEVREIARLAAIARCFPDLLRTPEAWCGREVHLHPASLESFAPHLGTWLPAWYSASRLVVPKSQQLLSAIALAAPHLKVDTAWRFNAELRGASVDVVDYGLAVRRSGNTELVVLGDAPLPTSSSGGEPYLEVCLDERGLDISDGANDFGIGVTACDPTDIDKLGIVAVEVPQSWVIDFSRTRVTLSHNDTDVARGSGGLCSGALQEGARIGLRVTSKGAVEVFVDGILREHLVPPDHLRVPTGTPLFAVLDLWGRSLKISRTLNEYPRP